MWFQAVVPTQVHLRFWFLTLHQPLLFQALLVLRCICGYLVTRWTESLHCSNHQNNSVKECVVFCIDKRFNKMMLPLRSFWMCLLGRDNLHSRRDEGLHKDRMMYILSSLSCKGWRLEGTDNTVAQRQMSGWREKDLKGSYWKSVPCVSVPLREGEAAPKWLRLQL